MNRFYKRIIAAGILVLALWLTWRYFNAALLMEGVRTFWRQPVLFFGAVLAYGGAFVCKAAAWKLYIARPVRFTSALYGVLYSLFINHLLPVKAGDVIRMHIMAVREKDVTISESIHSVVVLRAMDMAVLLFLTAGGLLWLDLPIEPSAFVFGGGVAVLAVLFFMWRRKPVFMQQQWQLIARALFGWRGAAIVLLTLFSWLLEAAVVYSALVSIGIQTNVMTSVFINSFTVAGQVFQVTPGGIGNYESFFVAGMKLSGYAAEPAYTAALLAHGLKFFFSYAAGFLVWQLYPLPLAEAKKWVSRKGWNKT